MKKIKLEIRFTPSGFKEIVIRKFEFVTKNFLKFPPPLEIRYAVCTEQQKM